MKSITELAEAITQPFNQEEAGLNVYRFNYLLGHVEMLGENFTAIHNILGIQNFRFFAREYLLSHPPNQANIEVFGEEFPTFLASRAELDGMPHLVEIARIDWLWTQRFGEPDPVLTWGGILAVWNQAHEGSPNQELEVSPETTVLVQLNGAGEEFLLEEIHY